MPELQLLSPSPPFIPLDADTVRAWMIWPDDAARREQVLKLDLATRASEVSNKLSRSTLRHMLTLALDAPRVEDIERESFKRTIQGVIAGCVFHQVVKKHRLGIATSLKAELGKARKAFGYRKSGKNVTWLFMDRFPDGP